MMAKIKTISEQIDQPAIYLGGRYHRLLSVERAGKDIIMTVEETGMGRWPWSDDVVTITRWRGNSTVWHNADTGQRCGYERPLSDLSTKWFWDREEKST